MANTKNNKPILDRIINNIWWIILISAGVTLFCGIFGFCEHSEHIICFRGFYESVRLLILNHQFEIGADVNCWLQAARWLGLWTFVLFSFRVYLLLIPEWWTKGTIKWFFKEHYVIFGQKELCMALIKQIKKDAKKTVQVVYIVDEDISKEYLKKYQSNTIKIISGNPLQDKERSVFAEANLIKASKFFAVCADDSQNVEIAKNIWKYLEKHPDTEKKKTEKKKMSQSEKNKLIKQESDSALRCYTLVKDNDFKNVVADNPLFKYERNPDEVFYFDGVVFNNAGIQYGVNMKIDKILPDKWENNPNILMVGYNDFAVAIMLNLAHILTKKHEPLKFFIVTEDKTAQTNFDKKYGYLRDFAECTFFPDLENCYAKETAFASIFVFNHDNSKAVSDAVAIRYKLRKNDPNIIILTRNPNYLEEVFNVEHTENKGKIFIFKEHNITVFNLLDDFWDLVIKQSEEIEKNAEYIHTGYNEGFKNSIEEYQQAESEMLPENRYDMLTESMKQSNRNAALDFYIKTYILTNETYKKSKMSTSFSAEEIEYLAEIEHRRWMLSYYDNGWVYGVVTNKKVNGKGEEIEDTKDNAYKVHECLVDWKKLDEKPKLKRTKDYDRAQIKLLELILKKQG